jgi:hypothetical protein
MPQFKSLPRALRALILTVAVGALFVLIVINIPGVVSTTFERFSGFLGGEGPKEAGTQERSSVGEGEYLSMVGEIQAGSEESFRDTDARFSRFDSLTSDDLERMRTNADGLRGYLDQVDNLDPPERYEGHYELFRAAIDDFYQAAELAHSLGSNPASLTKSSLDEYRLYRDRATSGLQQANEVLDQVSNLTGSSTTTIEDMTVSQLFDPERSVT